MGPDCWTGNEDAILKYLKGYYWSGGPVLSKPSKLNNGLVDFAWTALFLLLSVICVFVVKRKTMNSGKHKKVENLNSFYCSEDRQLFPVTSRNTLSKRALRKSNNLIKV